jgi:tight adherence protein B
VTGPAATAATGVVLAAAAGWVVSVPSPSRRLTPSSGGSAARRVDVRRTWQVARTMRLARLLLIGLNTAGVGVVLLTMLAAPIPAITAAMGGAVLARRFRAARSRREALRQRGADVVVLRALAAELRTGLSPVAALQASADAGSDRADHVLGQRMRAAAAAERFGGDPAARLREGGAATLAGAALAAVWSASRLTGASLAAPVARIAAAAAADHRAVREAQAALASARSSARLLATLPLIGALLGAVSGAGSLHVLFATGPGQACLLVGAVLDLVGLAWLDRLAARVGA